MRLKLATRIVTLIVVIFLPIALFGLMASVNEYRDQGISGAVDCNGPPTVMLFIAPSLFVYAAGAAYYGLLLKSGRRSLMTAVLMTLCVVMMLASGKKSWAAYSEQRRPEHRESCGEGW